MDPIHSTPQPDAGQTTPPQTQGSTIPSPPKEEQRKKHPTVKELQEHSAKLTELAARAQADLQNFKMRMEREAEELRKFAIVPFLLKLLPIRDDLARALHHSRSSGTGQAADNHHGLQQILEKLDKVLGEAGVVRMDALGKSFDPKKHDVLTVGPGGKDIVLSVHEEGYELHGRVLRPAKVQVGDGAGTPQTSQP